MKHHNLIYFLLISVVFLVMTGCDNNDDLNFQADGNNLVELMLTPSVKCSMEDVHRSVNSDNGKLSDGTYNFGMFLGKIKDADTGNSYIAETDSLNNFRARYIVTKANPSWQFLIDGAEFESLSVQANKSYDMLAYYPYEKKISDPTHVEFDSHNARDWMIADPVKINSLSNVKDGKLQVPLEFIHMMTCVVFKIHTKYLTYPYIKKISLQDSKGRICTEGSLNLITREIVRGNNSGALEYEYKNFYLYSDTETTIEYIFPEITDIEEGEFKLVIYYENTDLTSEYIVPLTFNDKKISAFQQGSKYIFKIKLDHVFTFEGLTIERESEWKPYPDFEMNIII